MSQKIVRAGQNVTPGIIDACPVAPFEPDGTTDRRASSVMNATRRADDSCHSAIPGRFAAAGPKRTAIPQVDLPQRQLAPAWGRDAPDMVMPAPVAIMTRRDDVGVDALTRARDRDATTPRLVHYGTGRTGPADLLHELVIRRYSAVAFM
jgi:hypothetical protein